MIPLATREAQAIACLEAADRHRVPLLALARKLTGCPEAGMDLYQQTLLNCHDAIQRNGFAGERYQFYLYTSLRNQFRKQSQLAGREVRLDFQALEAGSAGRNDEGSAPWAAKAVNRQLAEPTTGLGAAPTSDPQAELAEQVMAEVRAQFSFADRIMLRLHIDGMPYRDIAAHFGQVQHTPIWRRVERMKAALRKTFAQAWANLTDPA
ncbi:sigma factor [Hymenobacter cheonanensis]|uniref:sigma factor n=1 Tax=Hymenobacter sp. CA2-7 TaxID=3063993 RepID=UPI002712D39D|nr:sigma factor [Hymenobacter sp. CA2-7]MDO7885997.1 sigma factor [Hymenobacter sp. CA2-7]